MPLGPKAIDFVELILTDGDVMTVPQIKSPFSFANMIVPFRFSSSCPCEVISIDLIDSDKYESEPRFLLQI